MFVARGRDTGGVFGYRGFVPFFSGAPAGVRGCSHQNPACAFRPTAGRILLAYAMGSNQKQLHNRSGANAAPRGRIMIGIIFPPQGCELGNSLHYFDYFVNYSFRLMHKSS